MDNFLRTYIGYVVVFWYFCSLNYIKDEKKI